MTAFVSASPVPRAWSGAALGRESSGSYSPDPLDQVRLTALMRRTSGAREVMVGLIDGPMAIGHPDLADADIREIPGGLRGSCSRASSAACVHGTFVAGVLTARRGSVAPAICPGCTLLVRPIFSESVTGNGGVPSATPDELAAAIIDTVEAGARVINMSAALLQPSTKGERALEEALGHALRRGVITVAAAGNQGTLGGSAIIRHPCVVPVVACDFQGRPLGQSNLGLSIGRRGLCAPGERITSLGSGGRPLTWGGTSAAAPFVTGALALLWSEFPHATAAQVRFALAQAHWPRRTTVVPPLLDAWEAYETIAAAQTRG